MDYATLDDVKGYARLTTQDATDDGELNKLITRVSRRIDMYTGYSLGYVNAQDLLIAPDRAKIDNQGLLHIHTYSPVVSLVTAASYRLAAPSATWTAISTDVLQTFPAKPDGSPSPESHTILASGWYLPYRSDARLQVRISYIGGYILGGDPPIPDDITQACCRLTMWAYKQRSAQFGRSGNSITGEWEAPANWPGDVKMQLEPWRAVWM